MAMLRALIGALLLFVLLLIRPSDAHGQADPRGPVRTISSAHLRLHYPPALESLARRAAVIGERAWAQLASELEAPSGPVDMLLTDNVDVSNGFAQVFPSNRVTIFSAPPVGTRELRFHDEWLSLVITHELAHIFHVDRARGVWRAGRLLYGRNPLFFPNSFTPSWVKEGLAVYYESMLTGSGRLVGTEFAGIARMAVRDSAWQPSSRWSLATSRFPRGQAAYAYGSMLIRRGATRSDASVRSFVDAIATHPVPFLLSRASGIGFGVPFSVLEADLRDSIALAMPDRAGDAAWTIVSTDGWYASAPRWVGTDSLMWSASTGREVTGLFIAPARAGARPERIARRNSIDINVAVGNEITYAETELLDPYVSRSDLRLLDRVSGKETRLTTGARLIMPDVRHDGSIVAVQLGADASSLVRVSRAGDVTALGPQPAGAGGERWAEPRWAPQGTHIAAIQLLASGEQRVVVIDTLGVLRLVVTGGRGVFASPSFSADGRRLVWSSDRSGSMQIETARIDLSAPDTLYWREGRVGVTLASSVSGGVYDPSLSPDGFRVAALFAGADGYHVAVALLDTTGPAIRAGWYSAANPVEKPNVPDSVRIMHSPSVPYSPLRQLVPRYWMPLTGEGRDGRITIGAGSSATDILGRHSWSASVLVQSGYHETDGHVAYRYAGLGVPVIDATVSQEWDGSFRSAAPSGALLGQVARRRRFATIAGTWLIPRVRRHFIATAGAQYEVRTFTAEVDSALGPPGSLLRTGTRYPSFFVNTGFSTTRTALSGVSVEEGVTLSQNTAYRWREGDPSTGSWRSLITLKGFVPLALPGYARHVLVLRTAAGMADTKTASEFRIGGVSGLNNELVPGIVIGDPVRPFPVRGVAPDVQRGTRALAGGVEYRAPLMMFSRLPSPFTIYMDRVSFVVFTDAARAWCPSSLAASGTPVCNRIGERDGWLASSGAELVLDMAVQYDIPLRLRLGAAAPYVAPAGVKRGGGLYVTLGGYF